LVDEGQDVAGVRCLELAHAKAEKNAALHPGDGFPLVATADGRPNGAALERGQQLLDDAQCVFRRILFRGRGGARLDPLAKLIDRQFFRAHSAPAACSADRTVSLCDSLIGTSGSRSTFWIRPIIARAALIGSGFDSMNAPRMSGRSRMCSC